MRSEFISPLPDGINFCTGWGQRSWFQIPVEPDNHVNLVSSFISSDLSFLNCKIKDVRGGDMWMSAAALKCSNSIFLHIQKMQLWKEWRNSQTASLWYRHKTHCGRKKKKTNELCSAYWTRGSDGYIDDTFFPGYGDAGAIDSRSTWWIYG